MADSFVSILVRILRLGRQPSAPAVQRPYPKLRNAVLDILAEGRRKNIINLLIEADITSMRTQLALHNEAGDQHLSLTACIAHLFARAVDQDRSMQAYRLGTSKMVLFDEVDVAMMVERELAGQPIPVVHIVRAANRKDAHQIQTELTTAKTEPFDIRGPQSRLEQRFFEFPLPLRRVIWWVIRRDPHLFKRFAGTVGVTSLGMYAQGPAVVVPITPMSLTLSIGGIEKKPLLEDGCLVEREVIRLNLGADHDLIDGAPLMRFGERFRKMVERGCLPSPPYSQQ
jgi:hypothetical protein